MLAASFRIRAFPLHHPRVLLDDKRQAETIGRHGGHSTEAIVALGRLGHLAVGIYHP